MAKDKIAKAFLTITKDKFTIDTIAEMIATKHLAEGDIVRLNGYYSAGDGANHIRKISKTDDGSGVQLANGLWANIVHNGEVNVSWFGAKGDGISEDFIIEKFFNFEAETYVFDKLIHHDRQLVFGKTNKTIIGLNGCGLVFTNIEGGGNYSSLVIYHSKNVTIDNMIFKLDSFKEGILISTIGDSENIIISNCHLENTRGIGINSTYNNKNFTIKNNRIFKCNFGIAAKFNGGIITENIISNKFSESEEFKQYGEWRPEFPYYDGIIVSGSDVSIIGNVIYDNGQSGIYASNLRDSSISGNVVYNNFNGGIDLGAVEEYENITNVAITSNSAHGNLNMALNLTKAFYCTASGNSLTNSSDKASVVVLENGSSNNTIVGNNIYNYSSIVDNRGVSLADNCSNNVVSSNNIIANIQIVGKSDLNYIEHQSAVKSTRGIEVDFTKKTGQEGLPNQVAIFKGSPIGYSVYTDKAVSLMNNDGVLMPFVVGNVEFGKGGEQNIIKGINNMQQSDALYLPKRGYNVGGGIWYDDTTKTYRGSDGTTQVIFQTSTNTVYSLDTPYHASNMQKLGILDSYHNYLSELHQYEKSQNVPEGVMNLNIVQPPVIPKEVEEYAKEYNLL